MSAPAPQANSRYQIASEVVREAFDDEVIVIDMRTGNYFSLNDTGAAVWTLLERGPSLGDIVDRMRTEYEGSEDEIFAGVKGLMSRLVEEGLVASAAEDLPPASLEPQDAKAEKKKFAPPVLEVYTDMQELLLLDPIHDVDETGWPQRLDESRK